MAIPYAADAPRLVVLNSVLLIEDDVDVRDAISEVLRDEGLRVDVCANGREAFDRLRGGLRPGAIVLDLMMPLMDGWEFRVAQRADPALSSIPVVTLSASVTAQAAAIDADAHLTKPVDAKQLVSTIERVLEQRARADMHARLLEADRLTSLGTLTSSVAHEINNPLSYVMANVELLARDILQRLGDTPQRGPQLTEAQLRRSVAQTREGLTRIQRIVRDLRTLSHPASNGCSPVDVCSVLDSCLNVVSGELLHRARLVKHFGDVPPVGGDEVRLGQVFLNLIVNAAHAIPEGDESRNRVEITVRAERADRVVVEVRDTGEGIPPEILGRIFEPFFTTKPIGDGTGLGLAICHGIVTGLGGTLHVSSEPGRGSLFRVVLPAFDTATYASGILRARSAPGVAPRR